MASKLISNNVNPCLVQWILSFLIGRSQSVRFQKALSSTKHTCTGCPQGTVLSPILFTLYTNDCSGTTTTPVIKYSDDTALQDLSNSDITYFDRVAEFVTWCKNNFLDLNVDKTKEMVIDFRKKTSVVPDLVIDGAKVERVSEYKYLGTTIDDQLNFTTNVNTIHKKCQSRLYCLRKLRNFGVNGTVLQGFYRCFIESVLTFSIICWYGSLSVKNKNVLSKIVNVCSKIVGVRQESLNALYERRAVRKARVMAVDESHGLSKYFELLPSGKRYRMPRFRTLRMKNSFIPNSISLMNK